MNSILQINIIKENIKYENEDKDDLLYLDSVKKNDNLKEGFTKDFECLYKINQIIEYLDNNYCVIEFNKSDYDSLSLEFKITIDNEKKGKLFSLISNLKNKFNFILRLNIQILSINNISS